jgi:hypothetical protein
VAIAPAAGAAEIGAAGSEAYARRTGLTPTVFVCAAVAGAGPA